MVLVFSGGISFSVCVREYHVSVTHIILGYILEALNIHKIKIAPFTRKCKKKYRVSNSNSFIAHLVLFGIFIKAPALGFMLFHESLCFLGGRKGSV